MPTLPCEPVFLLIEPGRDGENCRNNVYGKSTVLNMHYVIQDIGFHVTLMRPDSILAVLLLGGGGGGGGGANLVRG